MVATEIEQLLGMSDFVYTRAISKLLKLKKRVKVVPGGSSAGKTYGILPILIDRACKTPNLEISVVGESIPFLRRGAIKDFIKIMQQTNRWIPDHWNRSLLTYRFTNGSWIEFFSADSPDKVRGPRRNILYCNEANHIDWESYYQLAIRTSQEIWIDFNPTTGDWWAYTELADDPDAEWLTLTYKDNSALPESIVKELEKALPKAYYDHTLEQPGLFAETNIKNTYWANFCRVYLFGLPGSLEGVIFNNWEIIDELPQEAQLLGYGIDFGYNDPAAIVAVYSWNGKRVVREICYRTGMLNSDIAKFIPDGVICYADSAEPKSIKELVDLGKYVYPAKKGPDSVTYGIQLMQQQEYLITADSTNLIKALRNYAWDSDKTGKVIDKPVHTWSHLPDALRYHEVMDLEGTGQEFFVMSF